MWNKPTVKQLAALPSLYSTEKQKLDKKNIVMHFFIGGTDWFIAEYDPKERLFFGYTILNNDLEMAEWGYISLDELQSLKVRNIEVDRDLHWKSKSFREVMQDYFLEHKEQRHAPGADQISNNIDQQTKTELHDHPQLNKKQAKVIAKQEIAKEIKLVDPYGIVHKGKVTEIPVDIEKEKQGMKDLKSKAKAFEHKRSAKSQAMDERKHNKQTLPLTKENFEKWRANPDQYDLQGIDTVKKLVKAFHAAKPFRIAPQIKETSYDKTDLEKARKYLKDHKHLYSESNKFFELQAEIARAIHNGIDPQLIDYAAHLSDDIKLSESLNNEREWELIESRGYK